MIMNIITLLTFLIFIHFIVSEDLEEYSQLSDMIKDSELPKGMTKYVDISFQY